MKSLKILKTPDKILTEEAKPVKSITPKILELVENMKYTLTKQKDPEGVGLAAPQIGESIQLFILREASDKPFKLFINPIVKLGKARTSKDEPKNNTLEGCLSIPALWGVVDRTPVVHVKYMDENGNTYNETFSGFIAEIIQHEYDHLQGILFPKRVLEAKRSLYRSTKDVKGQDVFTLVSQSINV